MTKPTVFVSGANGFIAQHIIQQLLDSKFYKIVGSVRDATKKDKLLRDFQCNPDLSILVIKDITKPDAFDSVFEEQGSSFEYIIHTASPVNLAKTDFQRETITPAINGTRNIFEATVKYAPKIKKFVYTSSVAAMLDVVSVTSTKITINEKSWNNMSLAIGLYNGSNAYVYSKTASEKTLWELHKNMNAQFAIVVINPTYVFGPQVFDSCVRPKLNLSNQVINTIVHSTLNNSSGVKITNGSAVDVRDVARAHIEALTNDYLNGQRLLLDNQAFSTQSIADIINTNFPQLKGKIVKIVNLGETGPDYSSFFDSRLTKILLGFQFIELSTSVIDTVSQILRVEGRD
ncbi:hypothetical protein ACO0QE_000117 [Hanseniaspora vineae]